jgi:hypothetical protein
VIAPPQLARIGARSCCGHALARRVIDRARRSSTIVVDLRRSLLGTAVALPLTRARNERILCVALADRHVGESLPARRAGPASAGD